MPRRPLALLALLLVLFAASARAAPRTLIGAKLYYSARLSTAAGQDQGSAQVYPPLGPRPAVSLADLQGLAAFVRNLAARVKPTRAFLRVYASDGKQKDFPVGDLSDPGLAAIADAANLWLNPAAPPPPPPPPAPVDPSAYRPRLLWTPEWQASWERARAENNPWWQKIQNTLAQQFGDDTAELLAFRYQVAKDPADAERLWNLTKPAIDGLTVPGTNVRTDAGLLWILALDWLRPWLQANPAYVPTAKNPATSKEAAYLRWLSAVMRENLRTSSVADSDATLSFYFQAAWLSLLAPDDAEVQAQWRGGYYTSATPVPVGGLDATSHLPTTARNAIAWYCDLAAGGEWFTGTDYLLNEEQLLTLGAEGCRTASGADHFPEVTALLPSLARGLASVHTLPLFSGKAEWGDTERLRQNFWIGSRESAIATAAGWLLRRGDPLAPAYQGFTEALAAYPGNGAESATYASRIYPRLPLLFDPYAPRADWKGALQPVTGGRAAGLTLWRDDAAGRIFQTQWPEETGIDHQPVYAADFQLWRQGEWAVTRPLGWGLFNQREGGGAVNGMLVGGLSRMAEACGTVAQETGPGYVFHVGTTGGQFLPASSSGPPTTFLHEWTRSTLYLPGDGDAADCVVTCDRVACDDPHALPGYSGYASWTQSVDRNFALKDPAGNPLGRAQWVLHAPVAPVLAPGGASWTTPGGQAVTLAALLPAAPRRAVIDERILAPAPGGLWPGDNLAFPVSERKWQLRLGSDAPWTVFLNVVSAGPPPAVELREAPGVEAAVIGAGGATVCVFGSTPPPKLPQLAWPASPISPKIAHDPQLKEKLGTRRLITAGFTLPDLPAATVYLCGLDPGLTWTANGLPLVPSSAGLARFDAPAGSLTVATSALPPPPPPPLPDPRSAMLFDTPLRRARIWNTANPWYPFIVARANAADNDETCAMNALAFVFSGNSAYAQRAYAWAAAHLFQSTAQQLLQDGHEAAGIIAAAWERNWLDAGLTAAQKATWDGWLRGIAESALSLNVVNSAQSSRTAIGLYVGLAFIDVTLGTSYRDRAFIDAGVSKPVGGGVATAADFATLRNALRWYGEHSAGGVLVEAPHLSLIQQPYVLMGVAGLDLPEWAPVLHDAALASLLALTPDLSTVYEWGQSDIDDRAVRHRHRVTLLGMLGGLNPDLQPLLRPATEELWNTNIAGGFPGRVPDWQFFLFYDPTASSVAWRTAAPKAGSAAGQGLSYLRPGWASSQPFLTVHVPTDVTRVFEHVSYLTDFRLWSGGWAYDRPEGFHAPEDYPGALMPAQVANALLLAGHGTMAERRGLEAQELDPGGAYAYWRASTSGRLRTGASAPPAYVSEATASLLYAGGKLFLCPRASALDPRTLPGYDLFTAAEKATIEAAPLKCQVIHLPLAAVLTPTGAAWSGGRVDCLAPASLSLFDERTWPAESVFPVHLPQRQLQLRIASSAPGLSVWPCVLQVGAGSVPQRVSAPGAEGLLCGSTLAVFGAGAQRLSDGWTLPLACGPVDCYLCDLDPARGWSLAADGGAPAPLTVSPAGLARITLPGVTSQLKLAGGNVQSGGKMQYEFQHSFDGGATPVSAGAAQSLSEITESGLAPGAAVMGRARGVSAAGAPGPWSDWVAGTVGANPPPPAPAKPVAVTVTPLGPGQVRIDCEDLAEPG